HTVLLLHLPFIVVLLDFTLSFFFSSRRRHTRFSRDWSSDVCSSDLTSNMFWMSVGVGSQCGSVPTALATSCVVEDPYIAEAYRRSEERRVGKECRSGWSP